MSKEPDIVRILRKEEKLGKLNSYTPIDNQYFKKCELLDKNIQINENYEKNNFVNTLDEDNSLFSDLMDIINFTESVSTSINGDFTQNEIINIIINKFRNSNKYSGSILLLSNDGKKLHIAATSSQPKKLKRAEKITGHNIKSYNISLEKSKIYSQVINEGKTVHFRIVDLIEELYPKTTAQIICKLINMNKQMHVATPLMIDGRTIGAFAMSSTILADYFIPSVKNLASHISYAFERGKYNLEENKVKKKLIQSEQMFRVMFEKSPFGILTVDIGGWVLSCNETFVKMTGYSKDELVGKNITNFPTIRKKDITRYYKIFKEVINGKIPKPFEIHWVNKVGNLCTGEIYISLIKNNNKITGVQAIIKDISETKETELKLKNIKQGYNSLFNSSLDLVYLCDFKGRFIDANKSALNLLGYNHDEIKKLDFLSIIDNKQILKAHSVIREIKKFGYQKNIQEFKLRKKNGEYVYVESMGSLIYHNEKPYAIQAIARDISERKNAEKLLIESEEKYKNLINLANDGIAIIKDRKIEFLNQRVADMLNFDANELLGKEFIKYIPQKEKNKLNQRYKMRMEGKKIPHIYESQLLKKNGDKLPVEINASLINYNGETADMAIIRDITERKQLEKELEQAKNHFQGMFNKMVDPVVIVDPKGKLLEITDKVEAITGFRREELVGRNFLRTKIVTNKSKRILIKNLIKRMSGTKLKPYEIEVLTKDRNIIYFEINAAKIEYKGKPADMVVFRDISERKMAEEALKKSEEKFRNIFEKANDGIIYLDKFGKILDVNKKAVGIFAGSKNELIGRNFAKLDIFQTKDIPKLMSNFAKIISGKELTLEVSIKNMKNQEIHLECSGSFMKKDGKHSGLLVIARDTTYRKKAEKELKEAHNRLHILNEELEKKVEERTAEVKKLLKQKDEFINQLGHDLKNPLNPIVNLLPFINKQISDPNTKEQLNIVMKNVTFMKNLVIKTIELARLNSTETEFILEYTDLTNEINKTIEKNQLFIFDKNIEIINNISEKIITKVDKLRLDELLDNLIINSIKFCPNGGFITFDGEDNGDFITISIKDTGIGLEDHQLNHIFDEFFKADKSRHDFDSSGLGLTICKRIVEKHGGTIWADSPGIGEGTTIYFTLPSYKKSDK